MYKKVNQKVCWQRGVLLGIAQGTKEYLINDGVACVKCVPVLWVIDSVQIVLYCFLYR